MSLKRGHSPESTSEIDVTSNVFRSSPIEDRSSTFIGLYSPTIRPKDLQELDEIKSASHKILAWRRESNQQSINKAKQYVTGFDDDGEKYGGKKIEKALVTAQVEGACVVARWYGGVLLGPVRFDHIEACARQAVIQWQEHQREASRKRQKVEQDEAERKRLANSLVERDQSIDVLRRLAAEKEDEVKQSEKSTNVSPDDVKLNLSAPKTGVVTNASKDTVDYEAMPLERLQALDRARDATLTFLLKRIDKAETELKAAIGQPKEPP